MGWEAQNSGQQWTTRYDRRGFLATPLEGNRTWGCSSFISLAVPSLRLLSRREYQLEMSADMTTWDGIDVAITCPPSGIMTFTDASPVPVMRFYRVVILQ